MADAIRTLMRSPQLTDALGRQARAAMEGNDAPGIARRFMECCERL